MEMNENTAVKKKKKYAALMDLPVYTIVFFILAFIVLSLFVSRAARSDKVLMIGGNALPVSTMSGVITAFSNIILILMVLIYKRLGFIVSVILILIQAPGLIMGIVKTHSLTSIPGLFISITTILTLLVISINQNRIRREQERMRILFEQTATALVNAIDAKDKYTHGHSARVAEYSKKLAEMGGKSEKKCMEIYYAALLHDVGKIGIPVSIINKKGPLTEEEYETVKQHPVLGAQILEKISEYPFLSVGANYHHERYDGTGYPKGLMGDDIPELARIISVADAYDAMTSIRSYRDPIPQHKVREEIVKGKGSQFDPVYANYMLHLIDLDTEYEMKERETAGDFVEKQDFVVGNHRSKVHDGILINSKKTMIRMTIGAEEEASGIKPEPSMVLFDSLDGCVHKEEIQKKDLLYFEYGEVWFDGHTEAAGARKIQSEVSQKGSVDVRKNGDYIVEAVRRKDHALIRVLGKKHTVEVIIALPDSTRYLYIGFTGSHCRYSEMEIIKMDEECPISYIPRIADEISYLDGPEGDVPNVQVDDYRSAHSAGVPVKNGTKIFFHAKTLPTARLVWHCPFIVLFSADDGRVKGKNYREFALIRLDGESYGQDESAQNVIITREKDNFSGWDAWKENCKKGFDCEALVETDKDKIIVSSENMGVEIESITTISDSPATIYAALTGDQVALTDIRVM